MTSTHENKRNLVPLLLCFANLRIKTQLFFVVISEMRSPYVSDKTDG